MRSFYFDISIWLDYYLKRGKNGEEAEKLILDIIKRGDIIVYSSFTIVELRKNGFFESEINEMLRIAKPDNIKIIHPTKIQIVEATKLAKQRNVPYGDALHAILSRDHNIQLVTRDPDFNKLKDVVNPKLPEELI